LEGQAALETRRKERDRKMTKKKQYEKLREADPTLPIKKPREPRVSKPKLTTQEVQKLAQAKLSMTPEWLISTDPGRIQMSKTVVFHNGELVYDEHIHKGRVKRKPRSFAYTAGQYYSEAGINTRTKKMNRRRASPNLREVDEQASSGSVVGTDVDAIVRCSLYQFMSAGKQPEIVAFKRCYI
jgi:hypothetical protein